MASHFPVCTCSGRGQMSDVRSLSANSRSHPGMNTCSVSADRKQVCRGSSTTIFSTRLLNQAVLMPALNRGSSGRVNMT